MYAESSTDRQAALRILQWYVDHGVDEALDDIACDHFALSSVPAPKITQGAVPEAAFVKAAIAQPAAAPAPAIIGGAQARKEAEALAAAAHTLDDLQQAIRSFEGLDVKATASSLVFAQGNPKADIMVIIDSPAGEDDRHGRPLAGPEGALFDKALACIGRSRSGEHHAESLYIAPVLNWRPPGNRTPTAAEMTTSLPFIARHIALVRPKLLLICGALAAGTLLGRSGEGISRLRKSDHFYMPQIPGVSHDPIPAVTTYPPSYILNTPVQKRAFWTDLLKLKALADTIGNGADSSSSNDKGNQIAP